MSAFQAMKAASKAAKETNKQFRHEFLEFPVLEQITLPDRRYYLDSDGFEYTSATTWLSRVTDHSSIDEWKKRVGEKEAERISKAATDRGTAVHELIEDYLMNREFRPQMDLAKRMFKQIRPLLNHIDDIQGIECQLCSRKMKIAGTSDCIGKYKGKLSIIDFKTSTREKRKDWIGNYFLQATLYSIMYYELFDVFIDQAVILIAVEKSIKPQEFTVNIREYIPEVIRLLESG
jgi:genome maintenance exonuclease 1